MSKKSFAGFEVFPWNRNFETGIAQIDGQHKQLVGLINKLAFYLGHRADEEQLNLVFDELAAYASFHFNDEERVWETYFPDEQKFIEHKKTHASFVDQVLAIKNQDKQLDEVVEDILKFLTHWLAFHILDSDMRSAKIVKGIQAGLHFEQAKANSDKEMSGSMQVLIETILQMYDALTSRTLDLMREKTARISSEKEIHEHQDRENFLSETIMKQLPGLVTIVDAHGMMQFWNQHWSDLTGVEYKPSNSMCFLDFFNGSDRGALKEILEKNQPIPNTSVYYDITVGGDVMGICLNARVVMHNNKPHTLIQGVLTSKS